MSQRLEKLKGLYELIPETNCKGLCQDSCGPVVFEDVERENVQSRFPGTKIPDPLKVIQSKDATCPLLKNDRCSIYEARPSICRLWGSVERLPCHHGCRPSSTMTDDGSSFVISQIMSL